MSGDGGSSGEGTHGEEYDKEECLCLFTVRFSLGGNVTTLGSWYPTELIPDSSFCELVD